MTSPPHPDNTLRFAAGLIAAALILALIHTLASCRSVRYVTAYRDSIRATATVDTLRLTDSVYLHEYAKGDTVYINKERTRYIYKYVGKTDTLRSISSNAQASEPRQEPKQTHIQTWKDRLRPLLAGMAAGAALALARRKIWSILKKTLSLP